MILSVAQYRELTSDETTPDAEIQNALYRYEAIINNYCGRTFGPQQYAERYYDVNSEPLILNNKNVREINEIVVGLETANVADLQVHYGEGFVYHLGAWAGQDVSITYWAGVDAPYDVKHILAVLAQGFMAGTTGGASEIHPIVRETVYGVTALEYGGAALDKPESAFAELGSFTSLLDRYREPVLA